MTCWRRRDGRSEGSSALVAVGFGHVPSGSGNDDEPNISSSVFVSGDDVSGGMFLR